MQRRRRGPDLRGMDLTSQQAALAPGAGGYLVQRRALSPGDRGGTEQVHAAAQQGTRGSGGPLPHLSVIQASFGSHDVGGVRAFVGGAARDASEQIGAEAYATGDSVAFKEAPDLFTAAHEAAHVVQQRAGVSLSGGVGQAGDRYELHADDVAALVVAGRSAEAKLDELAGGGGAGAVQGRGAIQMWTAGTKNTESVNKLLTKTTVGIATPPDVVMSQYQGDYVPNVYFNIARGFDDSGSLYVHSTGNGAKKTKVPNKEEEWAERPKAKVNKGDLIAPGRNAKPGVSKLGAHLQAEYEATVFEDGKDCRSPKVRMGAYYSAFGGTTLSSKVAEKMDAKHAFEVGTGGGGLALTSFSQTLYSATNAVVSSSSSVTMGQTVSKEKSSQLSIAGKGTASKGGGTGKSVGGEISVGGEWSWKQAEADAYTTASSSSFSEAKSAGKSFQVSYSAPAGMKGVVMCFPFTKKKVDEVKSIKHASGHVKSGPTPAMERAYIGYNIPTAPLNVVGVDPGWLKGVEAALDECDALYRACGVLERKLASAPRSRKEAIARKLDAKKKALQAAIARLQSVPFKRSAAMEAAKKLALSINSPKAATQAPHKVDALGTRMASIATWSAYALKLSGVK